MNDWKFDYGDKIKEDPMTGINSYTVKRRVKDVDNGNEFYVVDDGSVSTDIILSKPYIEDRYEEDHE